jgi:hypothetical protein
MKRAIPIPRFPKKAPPPPGGVFAFPRSTKPFSTLDAVVLKPLPDIWKAVTSRKDGRGRLNEPFNLQR